MAGGKIKRFFDYFNPTKDEAPPNEPQSQPIEANPQHFEESPQPQPVAAQPAPPPKAITPEKSEPNEPNTKALPLTTVFVDFDYLTYAVTSTFQRRPSVENLLAVLNRHGRPVDIKFFGHFAKDETTKQVLISLRQHNIEAVETSVTTAEGQQLDANASTMLLALVKLFTMHKIQQQIIIVSENPLLAPIITQIRQWGSEVGLVDVTGQCSQDLQAVASWHDRYTFYNENPYACRRAIISCFSFIFFELDNPQAPTFSGISKMVLKQHPQFAESFVSQQINQLIGCGVLERLAKPASWDKTQIIQRLYVNWQAAEELRLYCPPSAAV